MRGPALLSALLLLACLAPSAQVRVCRAQAAAPRLHALRKLRFTAACAESDPAQAAAANVTTCLELAQLMADPSVAEITLLANLRVDGCVQGWKAGQVDIARDLTIQAVRSSQR